MTWFDGIDENPSRNRSQVSSDLEHRIVSHGLREGGAGPTETGLTTLLCCKLYTRALRLYHTYVNPAGWTFCSPDSPSSSSMLCSRRSFSTSQRTL